MSRALLVLDSDFQRRKAAEWAWHLKDGTRVEFKGPKRTLDQNSLFWVLLTEVATQLRWHGQKLTPDDWKLQFLDALRRSKQEELRIVPNIDNTGFVNLSSSSSDLSKDEMSEMIELIYAFGAKHEVTFHTPHSPAANNDAGEAASVPSPSDAATNSPGSIPPAQPGDSATDDPPPSSVGGAPSSGDEPELAAGATSKEADGLPSAPAADEQALVNSAKSNTAFLKAEMVKKVLAMAGDKMPVQERLELLDANKQLWIDQMPGHPTLVGSVFRAAVKVARGELTKANALQMLEGL